VLCTATIQSDNSWSCVPSPTPEHGDVLTAIVTDPTTSTMSGPAIVTVDQKAPEPPKVDPILEGDDKITGMGEPGSTINISPVTCSNDPIIVDEDGNWECSDPNPVLVEGQVITVTATDKTGNESDPTQETVLNATDSDGDGVPNEEEDKAQNNGDGNGDGTLDKFQPHVSSQVSSVTSTPVTLEVSGPNCRLIDGYAIVDEASNAVDDTDYVYPLGLFDFELVCTDPGLTTSVSFYFDQIYDTSEWEWRKFDRNGQVYATMRDEVSYNTVQVGASMVSSATYSISDGGALDEDGIVNSRILDPSGPAVPADTLSETGSRMVYYTISIGVIITAAAVLLKNARKREWYEK